MKHLPLTKVLLFSVTIILFVAPLHAQDATTEVSEPATQTETATATEVSTAEETIEITPIPLPTEVAETSVIVSPTAEAEITPIIPTSFVTDTSTNWNLIYHEMFTDGTFDQWAIGEGWAFVNRTEDSAFETYESTTATYTGAYYVDSALQVTTYGHDAIVKLAVRQSAAGNYQAVLMPDGHLLLQRSNVTVAETFVPIEESNAMTLYLSAQHGVVNVRVNDVETLRFEDTAPLDAGSLTIHVVFPEGAILDASPLQIDDVLIWTMDSTTIATAIPTETPIPTHPTQMPTSESSTMLNAGESLLYYTDFELESMNEWQITGDWQRSNLRAYLKIKEQVA